MQLVREVKFIFYSDAEVRAKWMKCWPVFLNLPSNGVSSAPTSAVVECIDQRTTTWNMFVACEVGISFACDFLLPSLCPLFCCFGFFLMPNFLFRVFPCAQFSVSVSCRVFDSVERSSFRGVA